MATDSSSPAASRPKRSHRRLRVLIVLNFLALGLYIFVRLDPTTVHALGPVAEAVHRLFNQAFVPAPTSPLLSAAARIFKVDIKALGGEASVMVINPGLLGTFGRSESFGATFTQTFDDEALARLARLHGDKIERLVLLNTRVTDAGLRHLQKMTALRHLMIFNQVWRGPRGDSGPFPTFITDDGLTPLKELMQLQSLNLIELPITDAGLDAIKDLSALQFLDLSRTKVQGTFLAGLKSLPQLTTLHLDGSDMTEDSLQALAGATNLQSLYLRGVPLTPNALPLLQAIPQLRDLDITGCGLLDKEVNALRASNPKLKVIQ
jgi:hypothetical protein